MFGFFKKKQEEISGTEAYITSRMNEKVVLRCVCGYAIVDEDADVFMMNFDDSLETLEEHQKYFSKDCNNCQQVISYGELDENSKWLFDKTVNFFIEEVNAEI